MSEKSALRLTPGKDALLEYKPVVYKAKTYVEYQGLVYKSLVDTTATFVPSEWELIGDLREVRVRTITDRNALTGSTPTTGTTGIHIPILDNTNVLVLHAQADPQVGADKFARYNYNKTSNTFLLLQVSTGSTGSNVSDYNLLTNKPPIISGITATAGVGLTGGGVFSGGVPPNRTTFTFSHADTSSQANINNTGLTYVQKLRFDTFGHVTGQTSSTWVHPDTSSQPAVNGSGTTYIQSIGVDTDGHITSIGQSTWVHPDTSSQGNVINTGSTVIQSISLDTDGHVIGISSATVSTGGGGVNFSVAGDSGGVISMPNGGILEITGGTNIQTVGTLHANRVGVRINLAPAGSTNQLQINGGGGLITASGNLSFTGNTTLLTNKLALTTVPVSGATTDQILTRNPVTGIVQRLGFNTIQNGIVGQPVTSIQFNGGGIFAGNSHFTYDPATSGVTIGTRGVGSVVGKNSLSIGLLNIASGSSSLTVGNTSRAGDNSFGGGLGTQNKGNYSIGYGYLNLISPTSTGSVALGGQNFADGSFSVAMGFAAKAVGSAAIAIGGGGGSGQEIVALSRAANISFNSSSPAPARPGVGASGQYSGIFAGQNHSIDATSFGAAIVGGHRTLTGTPGLNISGSTYVDYVNVSNLAIWTTPPAGGSDDVLTWNSTSKKINKVTQASLSSSSSPAGADGYIQLRNATGTFGATANLVFVTGSSTLITSNLNLGTNPASGSTGNVFLTRNVSTGNVERLSIASIPGAPKYSVQFNSGVGFSGDSRFTYSAQTRTLKLGNNTFGGRIIVGTSTGFTGDHSISIGTSNSNSASSLVVGTSNSVTNGSYHFVAGASNRTLDAATLKYMIGAGNQTTGNNSFAFGTRNFVYNRGTFLQSASFTIGDSNTSSGQTSIAIGTLTKSIGNLSIAMGNGFSSTLPLLSSGDNAINISINTNLQSVGGGANAQNASIFGGINHSIDGFSDTGTIVGGQSNKIRGNALKSTIVGGGSNMISGTSNQATIIGGNGNIVGNTGGGSYQSGGIAMGSNNVMKGAGALYSVIIGGANNLMIGSGSTQNNLILGANQVSIRSGSQNTQILGGTFNVISGSSGSPTVQLSTIINGSTNKILNVAVQSAIVAGSNNIISGSSTQLQSAGIFAGTQNKIIGNKTNGVIIGGSVNTMSGSTNNVNSIIIGGTLHSIVDAANAGVSGGYHAMVGGYNNTIVNGGPSNLYMTIAGAASSKIANSAGAFIGGGNINFISGTTGAPNALFSAILGGQQNLVSQSKYASIISGLLNNVTSTSDNSVIIGATNSVLSASTLSSIISGFAHNLWNTQRSVILGGSQNKIDGAQRAAIIGGSSIKLSGTSQNDNVVVPNLMIWNTPSAGVVGVDSLLSYNSTTKKVGIMAGNILQPNVAYVSKSGNNGTAQVGNSSKPYLTITAAITAVVASSPSISSTNRGLVIVTQGQYAENVTFKNYVDINLIDSEFLELNDGGVSGNTKVYGSGKFRNINSTASASIISVDVDEINYPAFNYAILINATGQPEVKVRANKITGNITANNGILVVKANYIQDGWISNFGSGGVNANIHVDVQYHKNIGNNPCVLMTSSATQNVNSYIRAQRMECMATGNTYTIDVDSNFAGKSTIIVDEVIGYGTIAPLHMLALNATNNLTFSGKVINKNAGNIAAAILQQSSTGTLKILGGSQFIPSGSASSITGFGNVAAIGQIFGKNALSGAPTIQVGTFTANSTYII